LNSSPGEPAARRRAGCYSPRFAWLPDNPDHTAALVCDDGNGRKVFSKVIEFTDFPMDAFTLWYANNTILLPSEYYSGLQMFAS
jgi:hypothetical protein